ncbi:MAG: DUF296 domain-containing protein [Firmicutes bacterium]|nr:DUF296 domain-containing protein [Bacillota bacterium]
MEIMSAQGTIGQDEAGQVVAHIHAGLAASESRILGGHLTPTGNIVAATVEVFIQEVCGVTLTRRYDPETEFSLFFLGPA